MNLKILNELERVIKTSPQVLRDFHLVGTAIIRNILQKKFCM